MMKEVFEKIIEFIHSEIERTTSYAEHDTLINVKFFVEGLAEEHKQQLSNDLEIISSLPSLYPLQPFEEEAVHRVVASVKNNSWIPCSVDNPKENGRYECWYMVSAIGEKKEYVPITLYWEDNIWLFHPNGFSMPTQSDVVAWKPIAPYQPKGE